MAAALAFALSFLPAGALGEQASEPGAAAAGQLDLGKYFSCAIIPGGQVKCWGYGADGELGLPAVTQIGATNTPAAEPPIDLGSGFTATAISAGDYHTCAIRTDGSVVCWGFGAQGRLGYGNTNDVGDTDTPGSAGAVSLPGGQAAVAITAGGDHTCVILKAAVGNSNVSCWGYGANGELGYGSFGTTAGDTASDTPNIEPTVDLGGHTARAISAGSNHTCAILDNYQISCWGYGGNGRLGYGATTDVYAPGDSTAMPPTVQTVMLPGSLTAKAISAGGQMTCAILSDGTVRCWGFGFAGQLGYGSQNSAGDCGAPSTSMCVPNTPNLLPPVNLGAGNQAVAISSGEAHTCVILQNGQVECWGYGADGGLGYGNTSNVGDAPTDTPDIAGPVNLGGHTAVAIAAGGMHTCATLDDGHVLCWGYGFNGQLGYCTEGNVGDTPTDTPNTVGPVNLVPGDGGQQCAPPAPPPPVAPTNSSPPSISGPALVGDTLTEQHGTWSPTPTAFSYQWERCDSTGARCSAVAGATGETFALVQADLGSTFRVLETASAGGASGAAVSSAPSAVVKAKKSPVSAEAARARSFRSCLAAGTARAKHLRALTHRGTKRQRRLARRRLARRLAAARTACVKRWGHTPGRVVDLTATAIGTTRVRLSFLAPGTSGYNAPAAAGFLVKQSPSPIRSQRAFNNAPALCHGSCRFNVPAVGTTIELTVTSLQPRTVYYYALAALDNVTGRVGPRSRTARVRTRG